MLSAKTKTDQDDWLNAIMKGLSQGVSIEQQSIIDNRSFRFFFKQMALKDEENSANTIPCSLMLTEEKIYVCHDEQENTLIRLLDSIKLDYVTKVSVDPDCLYYCVLVCPTNKSKIFINLFFFSILDVRTRKSRI